MKKDIKQGNIQKKLYVQHQNTKKDNNLKLGYNKKMVILLAWCDEFKKKKTRI